MLHQLITPTGLRADLDLLLGSALDSLNPPQPRADLDLLLGSALDSFNPPRPRAGLDLLLGWLSAATFNLVLIEGVDCGDYFM
jgi:hypothetical protein